MQIKYYFVKLISNLLHNTYLNQKLLCNSTKSLFNIQHNIYSNGDKTVYISHTTYNHCVSPKNSLSR